MRSVLLFTLSLLTTLLIAPIERARASDTLIDLPGVNIQTGLDGTSVSLPGVDIDTGYGSNASPAFDTSVMMPSHDTTIIDTDVGSQITTLTTERGRVHGQRDGTHSRDNTRNHHGRY